MIPLKGLRTLYTTLWAIALGCCAPLLHAGDAPALPPSYVAEYTLHGYGAIIGRTRWRLTQDAASRAVFEQRTWPEGLAKLLVNQSIEERTQLTLHEGAPRPKQYSYERTGKKPRTSRLAFDWAAMRVEGIRKGETVSLPLEIGMHDKMSYILALIRSLAAGNNSLRYQVTDGRKTKTYAFTEPKLVEIDTALGRIAAVELTRLRDGDERETTYWLAPSLSYIPVRIEHKERSGEHVIAQIETLNWEP